MPVPDPTPTSEISLEPIHLIEKSNAIMRLGSMMLAAGTGSYRIKEAMLRATRALGIDDLHVQITASELVATFFRGSIFRTRVAEVRPGGVNADRIVELARLSTHMPAGMMPDELNRRLTAIESRAPHYGTVLTLLATVMACSGFAFLNNGGWEECLGVALAVTLGQFTRVVLTRLHLNALAVAAVAALVASAGYVLILAGIDQLFSQSSALHDAGFTSALLFLVPGFPLMTGALDVGRLDLSAGVPRLVYSGMLLLAASLSAWGVALVFSLAPAAAPTPDWPLAALLGARVLAGFLGVTGFAIIFNTPLPIAIGAACIGGLGNALRLTAIDAGWPIQAATISAAVLVGLLAFAIAKPLRSPRITLTVPAVLIMVPGASAYRALVYLNAGDTVQAATNGVQALFTIVSIAVGLTIARVLTEREWRFDRPHRA